MMRLAIILDDVGFGPLLEAAESLGFDPGPDPEPWTPAAADAVVVQEALEFLAWLGVTVLVTCQGALYPLNTPECDPKVWLHNTEPFDLVEAKKHYRKETL